MNKSILFAAVAAANFLTAAPLEAAPTITNEANCSATTPSPQAVACSGFWTSNVLNNSAAALNAQQMALAAIGYNFNTSMFGSLTSSGSLTSNMLNFGETLYGITDIGVHFGDAGTGLGDRTVFYEFNFGTAGNADITLNTPGFSDAVLYVTNAVPEPSSWVMMLLGFAGIAGALTRRRKLSIVAA